MTKKLAVFLCVGLAILLLDILLDSKNQDKTIVLYDDEINALIETWKAQVGRPPNDQDLQGIINQLIEEEILYREALKLNLDKDDIIIKRRLAQKIGFLKQEEKSNPPTEMELREYFDSRESEYFMEARYTFTHLYFSKDKEGSNRAQAAIDILANKNEAPDSDPFLIGKNFINKTAKEVDRDFGLGFSQNLITAEINIWLGPFKSIYGSHLVKVSRVTQAQSPNYEEVKREVLMDYLLDQKQEGMKSFINELKKNYEVQINPEFNYQTR